VGRSVFPFVRRDGSTAEADSMRKGRSEHSLSGRGCLADMRGVLMEVADRTGLDQEWQGGTG
jgi:hypothetical protein